MRFKIRLHGELKSIAGKETYEADAETPAEAIRGVSLQIPNLLRKDGRRFVCRVKECDTKEKLMSVGELCDLNIVPTYSCAGGGGSKVMGWVNVVIGAILITVGAFMIYTGVGAPWGAALIVTGAGMMLNGIVTLLTPTPKMSTSDSPEESKTFGSKQNTTAIGTRIPIGYGKYRVYGQVLSYQTQAVSR